MADNLPALTGDSNVLLAAIAKAAAELAAQETHKRRDDERLTRDDVEQIANEVVKAVFLRFGIDLSDNKSIKDWSETFSHAERAKGWWVKAGATLFTGIVTALVGGLIAAVVKFVSIGGVK